MAILETALNSALAEVLSSHGFHATPEQTRTGTGAKRCDIQIRREYGDRYYTALECKVGQTLEKQREAVKDAQRWLKQSDCWNAVACCYPPQLTKEDQKSPMRRLAETSDLMMVQVNQSGTIGRWRRGSSVDLIRIADDIGTNETCVITDTLRRAIMCASEEIDITTGEEIASVLELPWNPANGGGTHVQPALPA